jgi:iron(III) transport system permease protein
MTKFGTAKRQLMLLARDPLLLFLQAPSFFPWRFCVYPWLGPRQELPGRAGGFSLENYARFAGFGYLWSALWNSILVGACTGIAGVLLGRGSLHPLPTAIPFKKLLHLLFILPIISPPFTSALSVLMLLGANGLITISSGTPGFQHLRVQG